MSHQTIQTGLIIYIFRYIHLSNKIYRRSVRCGAIIPQIWVSEPIGAGLPAKYPGIKRNGGAKRHFDSLLCMLRVYCEHYRR